jgi:outer membrane murein-binding lipoprotein Lpp
MRVLENEVEGEKAVTRHVLEHARLNGDDLAAMKAQLVHLADDMVLVKTTLNSHGLRLNVLTQDVGLLRQDVGALHRDVGAMRSGMDTMRSDMDTLRSDVDTMRSDMATVRADITAIRAAVAPRREPPPN